jgi:hypothetical protein
MNLTTERERKYQATEIQLDGKRSQHLYVFRSGNLLANTWLDKNHRRHTISAKGCLPYGASYSMYWKTGDNLLPNSLSSVERPSRVQILSSEHHVVIPKDLSLSPLLLVSGELLQSLSTSSRLELRRRGTSKDYHQMVKID